METKWKYPVIGALAGLANGLFGSGGGLFLVPLLTAWTGMEQKRAFATSVAIVTLLSPFSLIVFFWRGSVDFGAVWPYLLGGSIGGVVAGLVFSRLSVTLLRRLFGALLIYGGIKAVLLL